jgi:hypothetical protein
VEGLLADDVPRGVVTINMGRPATTPRDQLELYLSIRDQLRPELVVQVLYLNDLGVDMDYLLRRIYRLKNEELRFAGSSYVLRFAERHVRSWLMRNYSHDYFRGGANRAERLARLTRLEADVRACRMAVEEGDAVYALALFPVLAKLDDYPFTDVHDAIRQFASAEGVPFLDLLDAFAGRDATQLRVSLANEHPNPEGHRIAAMRMARYLREAVLPLLDR